MSQIITKIDVRAELELYDWPRAIWTPDRLIACSPFRTDRTPSFFVDLREDSEYYGCWADMGPASDGYASGNFPKLLAYLRNETYADCIRYLRAKYEGDEGETLELRIPTLQVRETYKPLPISVLDEYKWRSPYLGGRGITEEVQRLMNVGYDRKSRAITLPWFNPDGTLGNIKYRRVTDKVFWYRSGGKHIRKMVYGLDIVYKHNVKRAVIVDGEVDALSLTEAGYCGIANGGSAFSDYKAELIRRSPIEELIVLRDNDRAGRKLQRDIIRKLAPYLSVKIATIPGRWSDANDVLKADEAAACGNCSAG